MSTRSLLVCCLLLGATACSDPAPTAAGSTASNEATAKETAEAAAPLPPPAASHDDALAALSGSAPPSAVASAPPPRASSSLGSISQQRQDAVAKELANLDLKVLGALDKAEKPPSVLNDGKVNQQLLDEAARSGRGSGDLRVGGGDAVLRPGAGGGGGLADVGERGASMAPAITISGKPMKEASAADVTKALEAAGCTSTRLDSPPADGRGVALFDATCKTKKFTVTFAPSGVTLDSSKLRDLERHGSVRQEGGAIIAVTPSSADDREQASRLLTELTGGKAEGPKANIAIGGASVSGGTVANASAVIAGMAAGFRRCHQRGLKEDPEATKGSVRLTIKVGPKGEVLDVTASPADKPSKLVVDCIKVRASTSTFDAPDGGSATIEVPITMMAQ